MLHSIYSIRPFSVALPFAALSFLAGCFSLAVLLVSAAIAPGPIASSNLSGPLNLSFRGMPPAAMLVAWPFITAAWGAVTAVATAWIYNVIVRFTGAIRVELGD